MSVMRSIIQYPMSMIKRPYTVPVLDENGELPGGVGGTSYTDADVDDHLSNGAVIGDASNNLSVASNGEVTLNGTARVYDGHFLDATNFRIPGAGEATEVIRGTGVAFEFADGKEESIYTQYRLPGTWVDTHNIIVVLLWDSPTTLARCNWEISYQFKALGEPMDDIAGVATEIGVEASSAVSTGLVESHLVLPVDVFTSGDKMVRLGVTRNGITDTLGDSAFLHAVLMRGVTNKLGGEL